MEGVDQADGKRARGAQSGTGRNVRECRQLYGKIDSEHPVGLSDDRMLDLVDHFAELDLAPIDPIWEFHKISLFSENHIEVVLDSSIDDMTRLLHVVGTEVRASAKETNPERSTTDDQGRSLA